MLLKRLHRILCCTCTVCAAPESFIRLLVMNFEHTSLLPGSIVYHMLHQVDNSGNSVEQQTTYVVNSGHSIRPDAFRKAVSSVHGKTTRRQLENPVHGIKIVDIQIAESQVGDTSTTWVSDVLDAEAASVCGFTECVQRTTSRIERLSTGPGVHQKVCWRSNQVLIMWPLRRARNSTVARGTHSTQPSLSRGLLDGCPLSQRRPPAWNLALR